MLRHTLSRKTDALLRPKVVRKTLVFMQVRPGCQEEKYSNQTTIDGEKSDQDLGSVKVLKSWFVSRLGPAKPPERPRREQQSRA